MCIKIFILGMPGSGKTKAANLFEKIAKTMKLTAEIYNDYDILYEWFKADTLGINFRPAKCDSFELLKRELIDEALKELERRVSAEEYYAKSDIVLIEFARDDYIHAMSQFTPDFLKGSYVLFINAENETCKARTRERAYKHASSDDHYVSDYIFENYYKRDSRLCIEEFKNSLASKSPQERSAVDGNNIFVIDNLKMHSLEKFHTQIEDVVVGILRHENEANASTLQLVGAAS